MLSSPGTFPSSTLAPVVELTLTPLPTCLANQLMQHLFAGHRWAARSLCLTDYYEVGMS
jgi:hypothetical protein